MQTQFIPKTRDEEREAERIALFARAGRGWPNQTEDEQWRLRNMRARFLASRRLSKGDDNWLIDLVTRCGT